MTDYILKDLDGNYFISITNKDENTLTQYEQLTHCLAVVKVDKDYLLAGTNGVTDGSFSAAVLKKTKHRGIALFVSATKN